MCLCTPCLFWRGEREGVWVLRDERLPCRLLYPTSAYRPSPSRIACQPRRLLTFMFLQLVLPAVRGVFGTIRRRERL